MMRYHACTCRPTTKAAGVIAKASDVGDHKRRGNTAKKANNNGPTATLVANGIHKSAAGTAGTTRQKAASRTGSASDTVASDASSIAPRSADGWESRLNATTIAKPSVISCARRNARRAGRPGPDRHSLRPDGRCRLTDDKVPSRSISIWNGFAGFR